MASLLQTLGWGWFHRRKLPPSVHFSERVHPAELPPLEPGDPGEPPELAFLPWSVARLDAIATALQERPDRSALDAARASRTCLSRLWLAAPVDGLETLYAGAIGQVYRKFLAGVLPALPLDGEEAAWRTALSQYLLGGLERSGSLNVLLALLPYVDRHGLQVSDPFNQLPAWILPLYAERCDPAIADRLNHNPDQPRALLQPAAPATVPATVPAAVPATASASAPLPVLAPLTGNACMALISDQDFLGRVSALINLYAIEPQDPEVCRDLDRSRRQVAQVWLDVEPDQLEVLYRTPFGQLTDNLIASNFAVEPLHQEDLNRRHQLAELAADLRHPHALNALMAALLYYPIRQVRLPTSRELLPTWLVAGLTRLGARMDGG
ncbi:MAG: hypothetical protein EBZ51_01225 [Synechococcaceae bacterium WB9_2_112]|nr:hypothetical protein [Synechococcaceae bacterium WB9_2_112]